MVDGVLEAARWILEDAIDHSDESSRQASLAWLKTAPLKALHPSSLQLCLGALSRLAVVQLWTASGSAGNTPILQNAVAAPDHITALCWACFGEPHAARCKDSYILVGTATGHLQVHSDSGALLHRQRLHTSAVTSLRMRVAGMHVSADDASEDVTVCFEDAAACFSSLELRSLVYIRKEVGPSNRWPTLSFNKWDTSRATGMRSDALCLGTKFAGLYSVMTSRDTSPSLLLLTVGRLPPIAAFEVKEHATQGTLALFSDMASTAVSGMAGLAKAAIVGRDDGYRAGLRKWLRGRSESESSEPPGSPMTPTDDESQAAEPATLWRSFKDDSRHITSLIPAPRGSLAAVTDNLGRVLLIDAASAAVLRVLKGYRDAQCAWLCLRLPPRVINTDASCAGTSTSGRQSIPADSLNSQQPHGRHHLSMNDQDQYSGSGDGGGLGSSGVSSHRSLPVASGMLAAGPPGSSDGGASEQLFLAVHAPKRGAVEVWETVYGPRLCSIKTGPDCCMLSAAPMFGLGQQQHREDLQAGRKIRCWMLDCQQGNLWSLEDAVMAAVTKGFS